MKKDRSQFINSIFILIGGILLIYELIRDDRNPYVLIIGLVILMFGLYRATNHWSYTKDDFKKKDVEEEEESTKNL